LNPDFRIAQRRKTMNLGNTFGVLSSYVLDRWLSAADVGAGTGTCTVSRQAFAVGQTAVPGDPQYFLRHVQTAAATAGAPTQKQRVESVRGFSGVPVTVTGSIKGSGALTAALKLTQNFGVGGGASSPVSTSPINVSVTTSYAEFSVEFSVPSIAGKTLGSSGSDHLELEIALPMGSTYTVELANVELRVGSGPSTFSPRPIAQELALCQRFYEKSYPYDVDPATATADGETRWMNWNSSAQTVFPEADTRFSVEKRGVPSITWYQPTGVAGQITTGGGGLNVTSTTGTNKRTTGYPNTAVAGGTGIGEAHWVADAEL